MTEQTRQFVREHRTDDVRSLMLSSARWKDVDMRQACVQIAAWQRARTKLPSWAAHDDILFPEQLPMEQCSSELTARYKAEVWKRQRTNGTPAQHIADLTGGFGIDATMLAQGNTRLTFVERNPDLCRLARHNLPLMGVQDIEVVCSDCETLLPTLPRQDLIYLDPARRDQHGSRTVALADCTPDVEQLQDPLLAHADYVMLKLSPMLDIADTLRRLRHVGEVHVVSVENECKELLLLLKSSPCRKELEGGYHCVNLSDRHPRQTFTFTPDEEQHATCLHTDTLGTYLYEPNASVLKAGGMRCVAQRFGLRKLHPNSHLYTSDLQQPDFPGRQFEVVAATDFNKKNMVHLLSDIRQANLTVRNFPLNVADLRRRLKLNEGGSDYLFATTLADERHVLIRCRKATAPPTASDTSDRP
ncbi:MAG: class I SAM-dependent methyltransferase [Bacteroidales bacterium]|nr:class I SAM-dependent methyltransferase [Bacteroidales bacterium]